jgi:ABC-type Fe3+/spermidine/putrescine transport system ATPase subunit
MLNAHIVKARHEFVVDVRISLRRGERLAIFGASGAGKSTVLSCIAGIETPDAGSIRFGQVGMFPPALALNRRPLAYMTQNDFLFPHLSVAQNVRFGIRDLAIDGNAGWIEELKERLGLSAIWSSPARKISGGQARRVAMARMLARRSPLVLLDEPFAALDRPLISELIEALVRWQREMGFTLIAVDHRSEILQRICPRVMVIERGRILQEGTWSDLAAAPATPLVADLLAPA